jgi:hypothetical protein
MDWQVEFYEDARGNAPVEAFLNEMGEKERAKVMALIATLKQQGPNLPFPYSSQVRGRLRELRTQSGKTKLRVLYFADATRAFVLLYGIVKNTDQLPEADIRIAEQRMGDHNERLKAKSKKQEGKR